MLTAAPPLVKCAFILSAGTAALAGRRRWLSLLVMFRVLVRFWVGLILLPQLFPVDVRATLRPGHPRLLITNDQSAAAVAQAKADPLRADSA